MSTILKLTKVTIHSKAREALEKVGGDWSKAQAQFQSWLDHDRKLYRELIGPMVSKAIWDGIRSVAATMRQEALTSGGDSSAYDHSKPNPDRAIADGALERVALRHLMEFPLQGGLVLGDATRPEVDAACELYAGLARGNARNEKWLKSISKALPNATRRVRKAMGEDDLAGLLEEARKATP